MFDFQDVADYAATTGDPLALSLVTLAHNVENFHRDAVKKDDGGFDATNFRPVDTSGGVGSVNPQAEAAAAVTE